MIDVYEMLRMKENDIVRVRKEIQALRFVAPMLLEPEEVQVLQPETDPGTAVGSMENDGTVENLPHDEPSPDSAELSDGIPPKRSRLRDLLGLAAGE